MILEVKNMIGIVDADLIGRKKHRFPNLACMKISSYYKQRGENVQLLLDYHNLNQYDKVYVSKVFTDTPVPKLIGNNIIYDGTGFFYDQATPLPYEIEHCMPDYHLYDKWLQSSNFKQTEIKYYTNYSIGFLTRGCFRHCEFCVNKKYNASVMHSPLMEFYDPTRKKICLLDDNFLACKDWRPLLEELQALNKPFVFKQGLDARLLTAEKSEMLFKSKYDDDFIFAFDDIADYDIIKDKLNIIRQHTNKHVKFYVLVGYDRTNQYDENFWRQDLFDMFERIKLLIEYKCVPYIMRYYKYEESPYKGTYTTVARWCNQPSVFKKKTMIEYIALDKSTRKGDKCASEEYYWKVRDELPELVEKYYNIKMDKGDVK